MPRFRSRAPIVQPAARARALTVQAAYKAARARLELAMVIPLIALVLLGNEYREEIFGLDLPVRVFTAIALLILGDGGGEDGRRDDHGPRPKADPPGHVTQEYES